MPGPLSKRIKPSPTPEPVALATPKKPKQPPPKRLRIFDEFDERGFHPTLQLRVMVDERGGFLAMHQLWRHKDTDKPEWRLVPFVDVQSVASEPLAG